MTRSTVVALGVAAVLLSAGCSGAGLRTPAAAGGAPAATRAGTTPPGTTRAATPSAAATATGALGARPAGVPPGAQPATVVRHVDGDTVWLRGRAPGVLAEAADTKVRILEIDTPEVFGHRECYGEQASDFAARRLPLGAVVWTLPDRGLKDRYGRTLLYLWTADGSFYDEDAVREGYARAVLFAPNDRYIALLRMAETDARSAARGLWGACPNASTESR